MGLLYPDCQSLRESKDEERGKENTKENGRGKMRDEGSFPCAVKRILMLILS